MEPPLHVLPQQLSFDRYDMADGVPVSMLFSMTAAPHVCGIYILEFTDGARYVGQTKNIVRRFTQHQHKHGDVTAFSFASCDEELLDAYERAVIKVEEQGHELRNRMLTDLPGGSGS